nr:MAG TPA: hypothetical protein [Caudoviricetes sp.]
MDVNGVVPISTATVQTMSFIRCKSHRAALTRLLA